VTIKVTPVNDLPVVTNPGNQFHSEGDSISLQIIASDQDSGFLTYSATGLPKGLSLHPHTGLISGQILPGTPGRHDVEITVTDGVAVPGVKIQFQFHVAQRYFFIFIPINTKGIWIETAGMSQPVQDAQEDIIYRRSADW
jgi:hypothetical protein